MKKFILLLIIPLLSFTQSYGDCISGDCENGYGTWHSHKTISLTNNDGEIVSTFNETTYTGTFKDGKFNGLGTEEFFYNDDGDILSYTYRGNFSNGKINGNCENIKTGPYGDFWRFIGEYKDGQRNGIGVIYEGDRGFIQETGTVGYWVNGKFIKEVAKF